MQYLWSGPPVFNCWISGIQLYVMVSPYIFFFYFLFLGMDVLGDDAAIS